MEISSKNPQKKEVQTPFPILVGPFLCQFQKSKKLTIYSVQFVHDTYTRVRYEQPVVITHTHLNCVFHSASHTFSFLFFSDMAKHASNIICLVNILHRYHRGNATTYLPV